MTDIELKHWMAVTTNSQYQWTEDAITRLDGRGALYYYGGENGVYMHIQPEGRLSVGTYEGAFPHIGEAFFTQKAAQDCDSFNQAFQKAIELGGQKFLQDMFSGQPSQLVLGVPIPPDLEDTSDPDLTPSALGMGMNMM